jgi:hypothetical protein
VYEACRGSRLGLGRGVLFQGLVGGGLIGI